MLLNAKDKLATLLTKIIQMKKILLLTGIIAGLFLTSCATKYTSVSKETVGYPGMVVNRSDYKLSKDVTAEVEVKEGKFLFGLIRTAKVTGENKKDQKTTAIQGYNLDPAGRIAAYRLLEANPQFDYLTNIRVKKESTKKWILFGTKYTTKVYITAKGITLNADL